MRVTVELVSVIAAVALPIIVGADSAVVTVPEIVAVTESPEVPCDFFPTISFADPPEGMVIVPSTV